VLGNYPLWWLATHFITLESDWYSGFLLIRSTINHAMGTYHLTYGGEKSNYHRGAGSKTVSELIAYFQNHTLQTKNAYPHYQPSRAKLAALANAALVDGMWTKLLNCPHLGENFPVNVKGCHTSCPATTHNLDLPTEFWKKCKVDETFGEEPDGVDENGFSFKYCKVISAGFCVSHLHCTPQSQKRNGGHIKCPGWFYNEFKLGQVKVRQLKCLCKCVGMVGNPGNFICQHVTKVTDKTKVMKTNEWAAKMGYVGIEGKKED
jgi:hypothetical protein